MPTQHASEQYTLELAEEHIGNLNGNVDRLNEVHEFVQTDVTPNTVAGSVQVYADAASGLPAVVSDSGATGNIPWAQQATFPAATITGTAVTTMGSGTYTANDAIAGAVYQVEVWGDGTWDGTTRQTLTFTVALGGSGAASQTLGTVWFSVAAGMNFRWYACGRVICSTTGSSGTWFSFLRGDVSSTTGNVSPGNGTTVDTGSFVGCPATAGLTKDTTVNQTLALQANWGGAATNGQTLSSRVALFRRIA